tara:strand:+ start:5137 stop:5916 length:780 start_codon:yes stop_codon:yes gene_type:complete
MSNLGGSGFSKDMRMSNMEQLLDLIQAEKNIKRTIKQGIPTPVDGNSGDMEIRIFKETNENTEPVEKVGIFIKVNNSWHIVGSSELAAGLNTIEQASEASTSRENYNGGRRVKKGFNPLGTPLVPHYDTDWFAFKINTGYDFQWDFGDLGPSDLKVYYTRTVGEPDSDNPLGRLRPKPPGEFTILINPYYSTYNASSSTRKEGVGFRYDVLSKSLNMRVAENRLVKYYDKVSSTFVEAAPASVRGSSGFVHWLRIKAWK